MVCVEVITPEVEIIEPVASGEKFMVPELTVNPVPAVMVVPATRLPVVVNEVTVGLLLRFTVTVDPEPLVLIFDPPSILRSPEDGAAVPEFVVKVVAIELPVFRLRELGPALKEIELSVEVSVANAGDAPVAPSNT